MTTIPSKASPKAAPEALNPLPPVAPESAIPAIVMAAPALRETTEAGMAETSTAMEKKMDQATRTVDGFNKAAEEAMEFGRGNVEALTKATQTYMSGMQELSKQAFTLMQSLNEQMMQNARALASVKSLKEAAEMQANFTKAQMERGMSEATKLNEAAFKLAEQSSAPIAARMTMAMERLARPAQLN